MARAGGRLTDRQKNQSGAGWKVNLKSLPEAARGAETSGARERKGVVIIVGVLGFWGYALWVLRS
jgi:hypothetical protein